MKYSSTKTPLQCFMRQSSWYKGTGAVPVLGILWHSTGANNPELRRYVQPDDNAEDRAYLLKLLGKNQYGNDWNHMAVQAGVHAFIGKLANSDVTTVQVGEWNRKAWGCGSGWRGSCNNGFIQFEIAEDSLTDPVYFEKVYREGCELTAYLCKKFNLDPNGTVDFAGTKVPVILCHHDSFKLGLGTGHVDIDHWFPRYGKSMQTVRDDVATLLAGGDPWKNDEEDEDVERWQTINDVPAGYYRKQVERLVNSGYLAGEDGKLDLTKDMLRTILICERMKGKS